MSKRKAQEKINYYKEKIKILQDDRRRWSRIIYSSSSSENEDDEIEQNTNCSLPAHDTIIPESQVAIEPAHSDDIPVPENLDDVPPPENLDDVPPPEINNELSVAENQTTTVAEPELDPDMVLALGDSTDDIPEFGNKIHDNLSKLWLPLLKKGLSKETRDNLQKEYLVPDNCRLLQAPKLNMEISAAVPDVVRNRDKNLAGWQQQLDYGISAINRAMDILLKGGDSDKLQATKHLSNSCRILCDLHASSTQNRIKLITPSLDKTFLQVIQDAERDETVFGNKLPEKIKAAKTIEKQGLQIKKATPKNVTPAQPANNRASYSGNWSAPPRYAPNRGGGRRYGRGRAAAGNYPRRTLPAPTPKTSTATKTRAQAP